MRLPVVFFMVTILFFLSGTAGAESQVVMKFNKNLEISARYVEGKPDLPAILLLHGFLQTGDFFTVQRLVEYLSAEGNSVLAPTLSLGITKRQMNLSCDAIHTHNMWDDLKEIDFWVDWLAKKGHRQIILVGHSYGSLQLLVYAGQHKNPNVEIKKIIGTSLVDIDYTVGKELNRSQIEKAKAMVARHENSLGNFQVSYCKKYTAASDAFLSYADWGGDKISGLLKQIHTPVYIILGSKDERMDQKWPEILKASNAKVVLIDGANHFFDAQYEFDLADTVSAIVKNNQN